MIAGAILRRTARTDPLLCGEGSLDLPRSLFFDYFDAKYLINLPERKDRLERVRKQFEKHDLSFDGVTLFEGVKCREKEGFPSLGARGCFLSHLGVFKDAEARGAEKILVMEDDLVFRRDLFIYQNRLVEELKHKKWGVVYFGNPAPGNEEGSTGLEVLDVLPSETGLQQTHLYAVQGKVLSRLIVYLETMLTRQAGDLNGGPMHVDGALSWFRRQNLDVVTLVSRALLGVQGSSRSDITPSKLDALPGAASVLELLRKIKNAKKNEE